MRIAVIGAGSMGTTLARRWSAAGHAVALGRRDPSTPASAPLPAGVVTSHVRAALAGADVTVICTPAAVLPDLLADHGPALTGRVVLDTTNALAGPPLDPANTTGPMHQLDVWTRHAPDARVHRVLCTVGWEVLADPRLAGGAADIPWAGPVDDEHVVARLVTDLGARPVWFGTTAEAADILDGLARAWFQLALTRGWGRHLAPVFLCGG